MTRAAFTILLVFLLGSACTPAETLGQAREKSLGGKYMEPRREELAIAERVFAGLFSPNRNTVEISDLARQIGLELVPIREAGEELLIVRELESQRRGRGMYVFRTKLCG